jgi:hypothetical protein
MNGFKKNKNGTFKRTSRTEVSSEQTDEHPTTDFKVVKENKKKELGK